MSDRRHRQKEQRAAKREAERKQEARRELGRRLLTALLFGLVVVAIFAFGGFFGGEGDSDDPATYEDYRERPTACGAERPPPEQVMTFEAPETQTDISEATSVTATIATSCGDIVLDLNTSGAPETVNSFVFLARAGFFDGQVIHRIAENFVIQAGDPDADGTGGPGYVIADEYPEEDFVYEEGVVAMANRGARSTGSQFFVVIGEAGRHLTNQFNVLGTVTSGNDAIEQIMAVETATAPGSVEQSRPLESVYIESITVDVAGS
ncbi:MAG: peptidylprolyl isomerase [Acidimicrobiia bacterium]